MLSEAERQILELVARGLSSAEIADRLGITLLEVQHRLGAVMQRLHARSKLHALRLALEAGLIKLSIDATILGLYVGYVGRAGVVA